MAVSLAAEKKGWDVLEPIDLVTGWNMDLASDRRRALRYIANEAPDAIVVALDCTPWSVLQNLNMKTPAAKEKLEKRRAKSMQHLAFTRR
eukprot:12892435-Prorocentrum_lima.AAC.1